MKNIAECLDRLAGTTEIEERTQFWEELLPISLVELDGAAITGDLLLKAIVSSGTALYDDEAAGSFHTLLLYHSKVAIGFFIDRVFNAGDFDQDVFGREALDYIWKCPETLKNPILTDFLCIAMQNVGGRVSFRFFRLIFRKGDFSVRKKVLKFMRGGADPHRVRKFLAWVKETANKDEKLRWFWLRRLKEVDASIPEGAAKANVWRGAGFMQSEIPY